MHRLFETALEDVVTLSKEASHHLSVVRPKNGEEIELFDGKGRVRTYKVESQKAPLVATGEVRNVERQKTEITLFACVTKGSRWDWTIEKAVELGATRIVPVISDRSIVRLAANERPAKAERWRRVALDAARQSDAAWLPEIVEAVDFEDSLKIVKDCDVVFTGALTNPPPKSFLDELNAQKDLSSVGVFVGPEGDFTPQEMEALLSCTIPVTFGPTILRAETAAIFALSVLSAFFRK
ncbi:MAG: 16S rRNA (uracil(1498)-N(3))-methyltransferase [Kiritimatiellae bacterium]|nr:16S rRNA (uracil(1498)-N(3))-methyltransferase [Kiritimatiellia bacterium]